MLTGGADDIGFECVSAYVREGAAVAVVDRDREKTAKTAAELGSDCIAVQADVGEGPVVEAAIHIVLSHYGKVDAVHNDAGIAIPSKPSDQTAEHEWDELIRVNVKSVLWTTRFTFSALVASKGSILNTASTRWR